MRHWYFVQNGSQGERPRSVTGAVKALPRKRTAEDGPWAIVLRRDDDREIARYIFYTGAGREGFPYNQYSSQKCRRGGRKRHIGIEKERLKVEDDVGIFYDPQRGPFGSSRTHAVVFAADSVFSLLSD